MNYPIKEQIVQAIVAAIKVISISNGYECDVSEVTRPRRTGELFVPKHLGVSVVQDPEQREPGKDALAGAVTGIAWRLSIACDCVVTLSESSTTPMDQLLNMIESDVRKALMVDDTFGGLVMESELGPNAYPEAGKGIEGVTVWIDVLYRVANNDPYQII